MKASETDRQAVLNALRAGVPPSSGQHLIQIGRATEIQAVEKNLDGITTGRNACRLIIGDYGAGKTFFLNLMRSASLRKQIVTMHADLTPERRLLGKKDEGRSLYNELAKKMATHDSPKQGAIKFLLDKIYLQAREEAKATGQAITSVLLVRFEPIETLGNARDFIKVLLLYCSAVESNDMMKQKEALYWLHGDYAGIREAKKAVGVSSVLGNIGLFNTLKMWAKVCQIAGYKGLVVFLDEMVNLFKLPNSISRQQNYEQILNMYNDLYSNSDWGLGMVMSGTPNFLEDRRRGLYSYEALRQRLDPSPFDSSERGTLTAPVLRLPALSQENFFLLLERIVELEQADLPRPRLDKDGIEAFMKRAYSTLGATYYLQPRLLLVKFMGLLDQLQENPSATWQTLVGQVGIEADHQGHMESSPDDLVDV